MIKQNDSDENKTVNCPPEGQNVELSQKKKRNRFRNIDWEQVLDFDTLAINSQVYEAPWMKSTKKRKRICKSSDKNQSASSLQMSSSDLKSSEYTSSLVSTSSINEINTVSTYKKIITSEEGNCGNGISKSKGGEKEQKKSSINSDSSSKANREMILESSINTTGKFDESMDEEEQNSSLLKNNEENPIINSFGKNTRLQSQKERESKTLSEESISPSKQPDQNTSSSLKGMKRNTEHSAIAANSLMIRSEEKANALLKTVTRQEGKRLLNSSNATENSSENIERGYSPRRNQYRKKFQRKVQSSASREESLCRADQKDYIIEDGKKANNSASSIQKLQPLTRSQMKRSPTSQRLNEDQVIINQSYDDSDASTRDEDHQDNNVCQNMALLKSQNGQATLQGDGRRVTRANNSLGQRASNSPTPQKKRVEGGEKKRVEEVEQEEVQSEEEEDEEGNEQEIESGGEEDEDENQEENVSDYKDQQYSSMLRSKQQKNKSTSSYSVEGAGDNNQINKNKKNNNTNNNQKNKKINKKLINQSQNDEIVNSKVTPNKLGSSEKNTSYQHIDLIGKTHSSDSLSKFSTQNNQRGDTKSVTNSSVQNLEEQNISQKKSNFSKKKTQTEEISSSSSLVSEQNLDKMEDEMNVEESGFENSNNNGQALLQQQNNQLEAELDQQQVPHLYIRNSDYATKVGRKYQAPIPELGSYQVQNNNHLERLVTQQKVWGSDWVDDKQKKVIVKSTAVLKQWYGNRRNEEQCINHLMLLDFDHTKYNLFLEENQDYFYNLYNQMDAKFIKRRSKKKSLYSSK